MLALTAFSLMHVPINVPSLSASTGKEDINMDDELMMHGYSNLISGALGGLQNYMCYSNSLLYFKSNGGGKIPGLILAAVTFYFFIVGPDSVSYLPRCMAGCLLIHLGIELAKEALWDSLEYFDSYEYLSVLVITLTMTVYGMTNGLEVGAFLSVCVLTLQMSRSFAKPIRKRIQATTLRSSRFRPRAQRDFLSKPAEEGGDNVLSSVTVLQLHGTYFFANASIFLQEFDTILKTSSMLDCLILDFTLVGYIDSSAQSTLASCLRMARGYEVALVLVRGSKEGFACRFVEYFFAP